MARPVELCKRIAQARSSVGALRRELPKPGPRQAPEQARCAYWLERARDSLAKAEQAWDEVDSQAPQGGDSDGEATT